MVDIEDSGGSCLSVFERRFPNSDTSIFGKKIANPGTFWRASRYATP
jgi:hypothetical protein